LKFYGRTIIHVLLVEVVLQLPKTILKQYVVVQQEEMDRVGFEPLISS
jgi:hypothetical protein